jgi:hypothetical protein
VGHCGRAICPNCAPFAAARRREQLQPLVAGNATAGRHFHVVLTLRHHFGVRWKELAGALKTIWRRMQQRVRWSGRKASEVQGEVLGFVRADEVTFGKNGWHHHCHVLLTLRQDVDPEAFREWFQTYWEQQAKKEGRSANFTAQDGWFEEIHPARLADVAEYVTKGADLDKGVVPREDGLERAASFADAQILEHVAAGEVLGGPAKHGAAPWDVPPERFVELWTESKGHRWFGVGGIWRTKKLEELADDDTAAAERETVGEELVSIDSERWKELFRHRGAREARAWLLGIVSNRDVDRDTFLREWNAFWRAWDDPANPYKNDEPTREAA